MHHFTLLHQTNSKCGNLQIVHEHFFIPAKKITLLM